MANNEWNNFRALHLGESIQKISKLYQTEKNKSMTPGEEVIPLTVGLIHKYFWDKHKNKGNPITIYVGQTYDGKDINGDLLTTKSEELGEETFVAGGHLIKMWGSLIYPATSGPIKHQYTQISKFWLSRYKFGPYRRDTNDKSFYYLSGYWKRDKSNEYTELQICSSPFNALSTDCMDEVNCYIAKSQIKL